MTDDEPGQAAPLRQTWSQPPHGTYLPKIALVDWTRIHNPTLTTSLDGATLEGYRREPLGPQTTTGYDCVAEAVGWRWRFQGVLEVQMAIAMQTESNVPVFVKSVGPVTAEAAPSGRTLQS